MGLRRAAKRPGRHRQRADEAAGDAQRVGQLADALVCDDNGRRWFEKERAVSDDAACRRNREADDEREILMRGWMRLLDLDGERK